jgi:hypothetical protein
VVSVNTCASEKYLRSTVAAAPFCAAALGNKDRAFEALERAAVVEPQHVPILLAYPGFAGLRSDPRMAPFRRRFNLP